jgi:hypothetical protein
MGAKLQSRVTTQVRLTNTDRAPLELWLEPWARLYLLEPQCSVDVVFEAETMGVPEVFHEAGRIVVYAWPTAIARVVRDGVELAESAQKP